MLVARKEVKRSRKLIWISILLTSSHDSSSNLSEMKFKLITPSHLNSIARHQALVLTCLLTVRYQIEKTIVKFKTFLCILFESWSELSLGKDKKRLKITKISEKSLKATTLVVIHLILFQGKTFCLHSTVVKLHRCYYNVCVRFPKKK